MTLSIAHPVAASLFDVNALRLTVNRVFRNAKKWGFGDPDNATHDALRASLRGFSKRLTDGRGVRSLADVHYGPPALAAMVDLASRLAWLESGVSVNAVGFRTLTTVVDRADTAVIAGTVDHGPALLDESAPLPLRLTAMGARVSWLSDQLDDAENEEEEGLARYFTRERDSLVWEIASHGSATLRAAGYRNDAQRDAAHRIPGLDS